MMQLLLVSVIYDQKRTALRQVQNTESRAAIFV